MEENNSRMPAGAIRKDKRSSERHISIRNTNGVLADFMLLTSKARMTGAGRDMEKGQARYQSDDR